jgi:hypothetical protein
LVRGRVRLRISFAEHAQFSHEAMPHIRLHHRPRPPVYNDRIVRDEHLPRKRGDARPAKALRKVSETVTPMDEPVAEPDPDGVSHWQTIVEAPYFEATPQPEAAKNNVPQPWPKQSSVTASEPSC